MLRRTALFVAGLLFVGCLVILPLAIGSGVCALLHVVCK